MEIETMAEGASPGPEVAAGAQTGSGVSAAVEAVRNFGAVTPETAGNDIPAPTTDLSRLGEVSPENPADYISDSVKHLGQLGAVTPENPADYISDSAAAVAKAESTGPQLEGKIPKTLRTMQEIKLQLAEDPAWFKEAEKNQEIDFETRKTAFDTVEKRYQKLIKLAPGVPPEHKNEYEEMLRQAKDQMEQIQTEIDQMVNEAFEEGILQFTYKELVDLYNEMNTAPPRSSWEDEGRAPTRTNRSVDVRKDADAYRETFWDYGSELWVIATGRSDVNVRELHSRYKGIGEYVFQRGARAIEKDLKGHKLSNSEIGDRIIFGIKQEKAWMEAKERKRATGDERLTYVTWSRRYEFNWARTITELEDSLFDWLEKFEQSMPVGESPEKLNQYVLEWRGNGIAALEVAFNRLGIAREGPEAQLLKDTVEAYVDVFGGVKLLESNGGFEAYTGYLEDFSYNFNRHLKAILLGNRKSLIMQRELSKNNGAIFHGGPANLEKPQDGQTETYRIELADEAKRYATVHEFYIRDKDFQEAGDRYGWNDNIEELLLTDQRDRAKVDAMPDSPEKIAALAKINARTNVFRRIKDRLDKEDITEEEKNAGITQGLFGLTPEQRQERIRTRIRRQMDKRCYKGRAEKIDGLEAKITEKYRRDFEKEISQLGLSAAEAQQKLDEKMTGAKTLIDEEVIREKDRALWGWVRDFNVLRERNGLEGWFPSYWDTVRLKINTSAKLGDRVLSDEEFEAMIEKVEDPYLDLEKDQIWEKVMAEEFSEEKIREEIANLGLPEEQAEALLNQRMNPTNIGNAVKERVEDILFEQEQRKNEANRAFKINLALQKFTGLAARYGGLVTRVIGDDGESFMKLIYEDTREILNAKIETERAQIEEKVEEYARTLTRFNLTPEQLEAAKLKKRRRLRADAVFGATFALEEIGLWRKGGWAVQDHSFYGDPSMIQGFAYLVGLSHNDKEKIINLVERGRREQEAVIHSGAMRFLEKNGGEFLFVVDDPLDPSAHRESWERARVVNNGADFPQRNIFECETMISTSGGVKVPDMIARIARLGVNDLLLEHGCNTMQDFLGLISRLDEVEAAKQSFFNIRQWAGPINYAKRLRSADVARKFLVGGEVKGVGKVPGLLNEVMKGAWRFRREILKASRWLNGIIKEKLGESDTPQTINDLLKEIQGYLESDKADPMNYLTPTAKDELIEVSGDILGYLRQYMQALEYVKDRAGYASKNWQFMCDLIYRAYAEELKKRRVVVALPGEEIRDKETGNLTGGRYTGGEIIDNEGAEALGSQGQSFAPQARSRLALEIYEAVFRGSTYELLEKKDARLLDIQARDTKEAMDRKREEIAARGIPAAVQRKIDLRTANLLRLNTSPGNITREQERLKNEYIERQLHMEFVGEWPAMAYREAA